MFSFLCMFKFSIVYIIATVCPFTVQWRFGSFLCANVNFVLKYTLLNFPIVKLGFCVSRKETFLMH